MGIDNIEEKGQLQILFKTETGRCPDNDVQYYADWLEDKLTEKKCRCGEEAVSHFCENCLQDFYAEVADV